MFSFFKKKEVVKYSNGGLFPPAILDILNDGGYATCLISKDRACITACGTAHLLSNVGKKHPLFKKVWETSVTKAGDSGEVSSAWVFHGKLPARKGKKK